MFYNNKQRGSKVFNSHSHKVTQLRQLLTDYGGKEAGRRGEREGGREIPGCSKPLPTLITVLPSWMC